MGSTALMAQDARTDLCPVMNAFLDTPSGSVLRSRFPDEEQLRLRLQVYQCLALNSLISEHALDAVSKTMGQNLTKTWTRFLLADMFMLQIDFSKSTVGVLIYDGSPDDLKDTSASIGRFWTRYHFLQIADQLNRLLVEDDAASLVHTMSNCISLTENWQENDDAISESVEARALQRMIGGAEVSAGRMKILIPAVDRLMFGFSPPEPEQLLENQEVGMKLAVPLKSGLMGWRDAGMPALPIYSADIYDTARAKTKDACPAG